MGSRPSDRFDEKQRKGYRPVRDTTNPLVLRRACCFAFQPAPPRCVSPGPLEP